MVLVVPAISDPLSEQRLLPSAVETLNSRAVWSPRNSLEEACLPKNDAITLQQFILIFKIIF